MVGRVACWSGQLPHPTNLGLRFLQAHKGRIRPTVRVCPGRKPIHRRQRVLACSGGPQDHRDQRFVGCLDRQIFVDEKILPPSCQLIFSGTILASRRCVTPLAWPSRPSVDLGVTHLEASVRGLPAVFPFPLN